MVLGGRTAIISLVSWGTSQDLLKHFLLVGLIEFAFTALNAKVTETENHYFTFTNLLNITQCF